MSCERLAEFSIGANNAHRFVRLILSLASLGRALTNGELALVAVGLGHDDTACLRMPNPFQAQTVRCKIHSKNRR